MVILNGVWEELMRAGWPALEETEIDGWVLRYAAGVTQRANSVLPLGKPDDLDGTVARVEEWYRERGLPAVFQLAPDTELDRHLADRGYVPGSPTSILAAPVSTTTGHAEIEDSPSREWLDLWWSVDGRGDEHALAVAEKIMGAGAALYATVHDSAGAAAVGRLALVGEWGGVYSLAVRPDARRRGLGAGVLAALLAAGKERGVTKTWLQVRAENATARRLYQRAGYAEVAGYHYRSQGRQNPVSSV